MVDFLPYDIDMLSLDSWHMVEAAYQLPVQVHHRLAYSRLSTICQGIVFGNFIYYMPVIAHLPYAIYHLSTSQAVGIVGASVGTQLGALKAAKDFHRSLLSRTMRAPMSFFDTTPTGRILNRDDNNSLLTLYTASRILLHRWGVAIFSTFLSKKYF